MGANKQTLMDKFFIIEETLVIKVYIDMVFMKNKMEKLRKEYGMRDTKMAILLFKWGWIKNKIKI